MKRRKPKYGEIWLVSFEPQVGREIQKKRPALVLSINEMRHLPTRIVIPIREHKKHHSTNVFCVPIEPNKDNGLTKKSTIDCAQIKSFDVQRFEKKLGKVTQEDLEEVRDIACWCLGKD